jgi:hypothetical protein
MTPQEAEVSYRLLKNLIDAHTISPDEFTKRVNELRLQDASGIWWQINQADGSWLHWNGNAWAAGIPNPAAALPTTHMATLGYPAFQQPVSLPVDATDPRIRQVKIMGILAIALSVISWIRYPYVIGALAVIMGLGTLILAQKKLSYPAILGAFGIAIALCSMLIDNFWLVLFPANIDLLAMVFR